MAYQKQTFTAGQTLTAAHMNHIESGIETLDVNKQEKLVSGSSIKTLNGQSLLGGGNISVETNKTVVNNEYIVNVDGTKDWYVSELNGDEVCDYYAINNKGEHVLVTGYGCTSYIDCYGCGEMQITMMQGKTSSNYGLAFYDENKVFISFVPNLVGSEIASVLQTVAIPENAHYFRASFFNYAQQKTYGEFSCTLIYKNGLLSNEGKRPYQDGYIFFSQRVNQDITKYWETAEVVQHGENYKVTTGVVTLPKTYSQTGKKTPLIVYAHGLSHYVYYGAWGNTETFREQKQHWLDMGFAVMDCNGARDSDRKGQFASGICPQGTNAYRQCVEYITKHYNVDPEIFIVAGSAGGALGWNYLSMFGNTVKAAVFISAWADLEFNAWTNGGSKALFTEFFGFNNTSTYEVDKTIGFDQKYRIVTIGNKDYCFMPYNVPIYGIYGGTETSLVDPMKKTFSALRNAGANARIRGIAGCGHEIVSGANIVVDTEIGNWLLSHYGKIESATAPSITYHTITYNYVDGDGNTIKEPTTEKVISGTVKTFTNAPAISGYSFSSVDTESATVTSDMTVTYVYTVSEEPEVPEEPDVPDTPVVEGNDLTALFTWDRTNWMAVTNPLWKSSSSFMSCFTDLSAYAGKTIEITVPQYTASNGQSSTGMSMWCTQPIEENAYIKTRLKAWDTDTNGNGKGVLVPIQAVVPAEAPYLWTSTYMDGVAAYVGPNSGREDFYCRVVE